MFRKKLKDLSENPEKVAKYYNIFTFLVMKYFQGYYALTLLGAYERSQVAAEKSGDAGSWWDVFDGMMWIISFIGGIILYGFLFS